MRAVDSSAAVVLYDFPELFDPLTRRIHEFLGQFHSVQIDSIYVQRSKDREDPGNPRNRKRMVSIQYQESVHCLAFVVHLLGRVRGDWQAVLADGLTVEAQAEPYLPPNPEDYPSVVDGRCEFRLQLGTTTVTGRTDFKRGAEWSKRRLIRGRGDGRPFEIDADFLEGHKRLIINGRSHEDGLTGDSYAEVLQTYNAWLQQVPREQLRFGGLYPHPRFAQLTYQLSGVLWRSSRERRSFTVPSLATLLAC